MFLSYILPIAILVAFIAIYYVRFSKPEAFPQGVRGVIPYISTVHFETLETEIVKQYSHQEQDEILQLAKVEQRCIQQRRLQWLAQQVNAIKCNIKLYRSAAAWELSQEGDQSTSQNSDRKRMAALILQQAPRCLLALMALSLQIRFAFVMSHIRPYNQTLNRPLVLVLHFVAQQYAHLTDYALTVAQSYSGVAYENLLSAL